MTAQVVRENAAHGPPVSAGSLVREARLRVGLSQTELAIKFGVSQSVFSKYENGAVPPPADLLLWCVESLRMAPEVVSPEQLVQLVRTRLRGESMNAVRVAIANVITCLPKAAQPRK